VVHELNAGRQGDEHGEPADAVEQHAPGGEHAPLSATEIHHPDRVAAERARPEEVEEHADGVEANVVEERTVEADRAPEERPADGAEPLPEQVEEHCRGERARVYPPHRRHQVARRHPRQHVGSHARRPGNAQKRQSGTTERWHAGSLVRVPAS
jgi:hypothetical protein